MRRWVRRLAVAAAVLGVTGVLTGALAWIITPSVANAAGLVRSRNALDGAPFPGSRPPIKVIDALVATEDASFFSNVGVDPKGLVRGAWGALTGSPDAGGATLEQQLAKILYTGGQSSPAQVAEQVVLGVKLDQHFGKDQLLHMYLSTVYFGDGAYGLDQAAARYFRLPADRLDWAQSALVAGLVQAPSAYDPLRHLTLAKERQRHVLDRLVATGVLTSAQADAAYAEPLALVATG